MSVSKKTTKKKLKPSYDLHIVIPVSVSAPRFKKRIDFIKDYGLQNFKNTKFKVTLLAGNEKVDINPKEWPYPVEVATGKFTHPAPKIYSYFAEYPENVSDYRWIAKIDDDAVTDVDGLVYMLDRDYDYKGDYYVCTDIAPPYGAPYYFEYRKILIDLGYGHWMCRNNSGSDKVDLIHEIEGCIMSQSCLEKILNNEDAIKLLKKSDLEEGGFGDHCLAFGARMCKIYPTDSPFLTRWPCVKELSIFGGRYYHIHHVSHDQPAFEEFIKLIQNKQVNLSLEEMKLTKKELLGKKWLFGRVGWGDLCRDIEFAENGKILGACWENEDGWELTADGKLVIKHVNGTPTTLFDQRDVTYNYIEGDFILEPEKKIRHYLKLLTQD